MIKTLPSREVLEAEALAVFQTTLAWAGRIGEVERPEPVRAGFASYDFRCDVTIERGAQVARGQKWQVRALFKSVLHPREARQVIGILKQNPPQDERGVPIYSLLIAPYISDAVAEICENAGIGWIDLSENRYLEFGGLWIEQRRKARKYKEIRGQKSLFTPKATRLLRIMLHGPLRAYKVEELAEAADISLGLVSKVRKLLLDQELAVDGKDGIRIVKPQEILRDWILQDNFKGRVETREYSLLEQDHEKIAKLLHSELGDIHHAFTQWTAAHIRHPHVPPQITSLYVESFPEELRLKNLLQVRRVESGGRLWLHKPTDQGVFIGQQTVCGLPLVSDLQSYLDLLELGHQLRSYEAAMELREDPTFSGGWT